MSRMFHDQVDSNGVTISLNSHSYGPPSADQVPGRPHWMAGRNGHDGYMEPPAEGIVHKTKDRVIAGQGSRPGAMSFDGDLLPRSERVPVSQASRGVEVHDPSCWCELCSKAKMRANAGMAAVPSAPRIYRK